MILATKKAWLYSTPHTIQSGVISLTYAKDTAIISLTNGFAVKSDMLVCSRYHQSLYGIGVPYRNCFIMQVKGSAIGVAGSFFVALVLYHKTAESATNIYPTDRHRSHIFASNGSKWNDRTQTPCKSKKRRRRTNMQTPLYKRFNSTISDIFWKYFLLQYHIKNR